MKTSSMCSFVIQSAPRARGSQHLPFAMASAADRFNINNQLEHLQSRYVGTGHADTNRFEWAVNIHRDSYASYVGRPTMMQYFAVAENESIGRVRYNMMQVRCSYDRVTAVI
jgi:splicing factor 3B subunit 5|tara:strand:+ start:2597 stop:2932 length:336 start_codon:yes stop_codon:yes gene_type:complete